MIEECSRDSDTRGVQSPAVNGASHPPYESEQSLRFYGIIVFYFFIDGLAKKFGLTPEQFSQNVRDSYQRFDVEQCQEEPLKEAEGYINK